MQLLIAFIIVMLKIDYRIEVPDSLYTKNPESSDLGKKIVSHSIDMIDSMGFEQFTFRKLGEKIGSNESSIYRYFHNKHMLLLYLSSWFWSWIEYRMVLETYSISDHWEKLVKAISIVTEKITEDSDFSRIDEQKLHRIMVNENSKSYLTKEVDKENKEGYFITYKRLISRIKDMILAVKPDYVFAASLASTILEASMHQHFLQDHFTSITTCDEQITPTDFILDLVSHSLKNKTS